MGRGPKGFEGIYSDVGKLVQGAAQNWMSGVGGVNTEGALNALLNPQQFNFSEYFQPMAAERDRIMKETMGQSAVLGGGFGNRFSRGTNDLMARSAGELGSQWAQADNAALLQDLARMDESRAAGITAYNQLGATGAGLVDQLLARIFQQLSGGEAIYDPGMIREIVPALITGGAYYAGRKG